MKIDLGYITDYSKVLPVNELYTAIQGEGSRAGMPTIVIRTTGCTHRCWFGDGGWCDAWRNSIHPEKGRYSFQDIVDIYDRHPHIKEMMLTGGSPSMHGTLVNTLTQFANERGIYITMETEGSHFIKTDYPINLISLSPKFSNSVPVVGVTTPGGKVVDERFIKTHNRFRLNYEKIAETIIHHKSFQIKPVIDKELKIVEEVEEFIVKLADILEEKHYGASGWTAPWDKQEILRLLNRQTYAMPAGDTREELIESYGPVMNMCIDKGWNFTGRPHIIAFDQDRCV